MVCIENFCLYSLPHAFENTGNSLELFFCIGYSPHTIRNGRVKIPANISGPPEQRNSFPRSAPWIQNRRPRIRNIHKIKFWSLLNPIIKSRKNSECVADDTCPLLSRRTPQRTMRRKNVAFCPPTEKKNSLAPHTSYLAVGEGSRTPGKRNDLQKDAFIQKRIDCANQTVPSEGRFGSFKNSFRLSGLVYNSIFFFPVQLPRAPFQKKET